MESGNSKEARNRVVKWIVIPLLFVAFLFTFTVPDLRSVGILYTVMGGYILFIFSLSRFKEELIGIRNRYFGQILVGLVAGIGFLVLSAISPVFSLLTPVISLSVAEDLRFLVIVIMAPLLEEPWRAATIALIRDVYKSSFTKAMIISAILFGLLHLFVYGVLLSGYDTWIQAYGAVKVISGSLLAAVIFGVLSGLLIKRYKSILPSLIAHVIINFVIFSKSGLVVVS